MPIAKITGQGLTAIAFSVGLLWTSIIVDQVNTRAAFTERARVVREMQRMQHRRTEPAASPSPFTRHRLHVTAG